ncbi:MAG: hypothetical protein AABN95_17155 [Acidobacteriota bacterium]
MAIASFALYVLTWAIMETLRSRKPDLGGLVFALLYITVFWAIIRLLPITIIGAVAGWLLYRCKLARSDPLRTVALTQNNGTRPSEVDDSRIAR